MNLDFSWLIKRSRSKLISSRFCMLGLPEIMGSSEARRGTKTFIRKNEAMFNFSRINWPEGELLNNSLYGLYECNHRTKTNKEKGRHLCAILRHQRLSIVKKKPSLKSVRPCHIFAIYFEINIVCVFGAELTIKPPFLTKNAQEYPWF